MCKDKLCKTVLVGFEFFPSNAIIMVKIRRLTLSTTWWRWWCWQGKIAFWISGCGVQRTAVKLRRLIKGPGQPTKGTHPNLVSRWQGWWGYPLSYHHYYSWSTFPSWWWYNSDKIGLVPFQHDDKSPTKLTCTLPRFPNFVTRHIWSWYKSNKIGPHPPLILFDRQDLKDLFLRRPKHSIRGSSPVLFYVQHQIHKISREVQYWKRRRSWKCSHINFFLNITLTFGWEWDDWRWEEEMIRCCERKWRRAL